MEVLRRAMRKSPNLFREQSNKKSRHTKLGEGWSENKEAVNDGITFYMKYIGQTLVEEANDGESYGNGASSKAVQNIISMAKAMGKKLKKVAITISPHGIKITDMVSKELIDDITIYRISFCSADKTHDKVFTFMARNTVNETMVCHAFLCAKRKIAQAVTLTVSKAFELAQDQCNATESNRRLSESIKQSNEQSKPKTNVLENNNNASHPSKNRPRNSSDPAIQIPKLTSPDSNASISSEPCFNWQNFEDEDNLDDDFSRLAENRIQTNCPLLFSTDLRQEDLDDSVAQYLDSNKCLEEFSRTKSMEDLLCL